MFSPWTLSPTLCAVLPATSFDHGRAELTNCIGSDQKVSLRVCRVYLLCRCPKCQRRDGESLRCRFPLRTVIDVSVNGRDDTRPGRNNAGHAKQVHANARPLRSTRS